MCVCLRKVETGRVFCVFLSFMDVFESGYEKYLQRVGSPLEQRVSEGLRIARVTQSF